MMRRFMLLCALAGIGLAPIGSGAAPTPVVAAEAADAAGVGRDARAVAEQFRDDSSAAANLSRAAGIAGHEARIEDATTFDFTDAMRRFYIAAGVAPHTFTPPAAPVAAAAAPVIAALARAVELTTGAMSNVSAADRAWAVTHLDLFEFPWTAEAGRLARIAEQVDMAALSTAAATLTSAIEQMPVPSIALAASWIDPTGAIEIGSTGSDVFATDRVLTLDLGGNDQHVNSAGAIGAIPGNTLGLPISVTADLGGDDYYAATTPNQPDNTLVAQGVGLGGVGLLYDRWGNDGYVTFLTGSYPVAQCAPDVVFQGYPGRFPQEIYAQGTGGLGVGALIDQSGDDFQYAYSFINTLSDCHFVRSYVHAQAAGLHRGVGVLIDDTGNDYRYIDNYSRSITFGNQDAVAGSYGQGFAAGGAGVLVDKEGDDYTFANSTATWNFANASKGTFATTMVQGAVAGLTYQYDSLSRRAAIGAATPALPLALPCLGGGGSAGGGAGGGQGVPGAPCQYHGVALHLDLLGSDTYHAFATSQHGNVANQCFVGSNALVGAQGSAAWGGVAVLANLDVEGNDSFLMQPYAQGTPCTTTAIAVGQGFGGAVRYPVWDDPNSFYAPVDGSIVATPVFYGGLRPALPAIGVLVSGGPACPPEARTIAVSPDPEVAAGCEASFDGPTNSPDRYESLPQARNAQGSAIAESRAQGSGGQPRANVAGSFPIPLPTMIGIGVIAETGGDDVYRSSAAALGASGSSALSVAQGATEGGIGALIDLLGNDQYESATFVTGGSRIEVDQGDARAGFGEPIRPIAILLDAGGKDVYGPTITCQGNGGLASAVVWGDLGSCGAVPGTVIVGIDALSGVTL